MWGKPKKRSLYAVQSGMRNDGVCEDVVENRVVCWFR